MNRRDFLKVSAKLAAVMGLASTAIPELAQGLEKMVSGNAPVLWLQGQSCAGCSISLLNTTEPGIASVVTQTLSLKFHPNLSAASGNNAIEIVNGIINQGDHLLVLEGSIPAGMPEACVMGNELFTDQFARAARRAKAVVAVGTCAAFGGIPAAENNPTGAVSAKAFLHDKGIEKPLINLPGCPCHPDWLVGTLVHFLSYGLPKLDDHARPTMFYGRTIHDQCPRFADYEREQFAQHFSDPGCLFKLGCLGPETHADCTLRLWNSGQNSCIHAGAPCIGCASEEFALKATLPFQRKVERQKQTLANK